MSNILSINTLKFSYEEPILKDISFNLKQGEIAAILGPSGCGKTTLLRAIAGFEKINAGEIVIDGQKMSGPSHHIEANQRKVGVVFQDSCLFGHLTVSENISFGIQSLSSYERGKRMNQLISILKLDPHVDKYPHELSGGQQQRVALARAFAQYPKLILMDEPFSNWDPALRESLCIEIRDILKILKMSAIVVTHDQAEAFAMADKMGVINHGVLEQWGTPYNLYHSPETPFVADFIGEGTFISGQFKSQNELMIDDIMYNCDKPDWANINQKVKIFVRPDDIHLNGKKNTHSVEITKRLFRGAHYLYHLKLNNGDTVLALIKSHNKYELGDQINIQVKMDGYCLFP